MTTAEDDPDVTAISDLFVPATRAFGDIAIVGKGKVVARHGLDRLRALPWRAVAIHRFDEISMR
jgi:hypothetical protein